jgi:hypothetical protein
MVGFQSRNGIYPFFEGFLIAVAEFWISKLRLPASLIIELDRPPVVKCALAIGHKRVNAYNNAIQK